MPTKNPYSFNCKIVKRSKGKSAVAGAAYQAGEKLIDERTGRRCNYSRKKGVVHSEILAPLNAPGWAMNRGTLWNAAEKAENRKDAQTARKFILALPKELTHEQRREYAREYILEQFIARGMVGDFSIHLPEIGKNQDNHHMHILATMREVGPEGFGQKNRDWNKTELLRKWREQWAVHTNRALAAAGFQPNWDQRTLEAQGEDRLPGIHLGPKVVEMEERGIPTDRGGRALEIAQANVMLDELQQIENEINDHESTRPCEASPQLPSTNRSTGTATQAGKPANCLTARPGGVHGTRFEKASTPAPENRKTAKPIQPIFRQVSQQQGGAEGMNLSPSEYHEFLRVKRFMEQLQAEETRRRQKELSGKQKKRVEELFQHVEAASMKRPDSLYWKDYFAMDCLQELHQRKQTVEQANWEEIESKVVCGLLADGATVKDAAEILYEKGVSHASSEKKTNPANPPDGQTTQERLKLEYLKILAAVNPDLANAVEQAEKRQEIEAINAQREKVQQAQAASPQPGA